MPHPQKRNAGPGWHLKSGVKESNAEQNLHTRFRLKAQALERLTDDLAAIADWKDDLRSRIAQAVTPQFELVDLDWFGLVPLDQKELQKLKCEVEEFRRVVRSRRAERRAV